MGSKLTVLSCLLFACGTENANVPDGALPDGGPRPTTCEGVTCGGHGTCTQGATTVRCECDADYVAAGLDCVPETVPDDGDLFPQLPATGSVTATAHPTESVSLGSSTIVSFGVPFPRGTIGDVGSIRITDADGTEIPAHIEELARWRSLSGDASVDSVRAALVQLPLTFSTLAPIELHVAWGAAPSSSLGPQGDPTASWVAITETSFFPDEYPGADVREPTVYVTLPPDWLSGCVLRSRTVPFGTDASWSWWDDVYPEFARTAVNDVDPRVTSDNRIDYVNDGEPWLFQRAMTLFGVYIRSGELEWLRHAHRAAQFYAAHINDAGYFDLVDTDLKYAYGSAMLLDLMLTGDRRQLARIERVATAGEEWNETYTIDTNFWTERHQAYALLAALTAWEATGDARHRDRAIRVASETFRMAGEPVGGWEAQGCVLHTLRAHEGVEDDRPICSPWMGALLVDAVFRYYVHSLDRAALEFLAGFADFVRLYALYPGGDGLDATMPYYLVSSTVQWSDDGPWADIEHTCDVGALVARGAWARRALGGDASELDATTGELMTSCQLNLDAWHRPAGPESGLSEWRLSPPRKFNWWFGTTLDLPWLATH